MSITKEETERHYREVLRIAEELQRALDEKTERVEKLEKALEWLFCDGSLTTIMKWEAEKARSNPHGKITPETCANALIALHERAGK